LRLLAEKKVAGIALPVYVLLTAAVLTAMWLGWLPDSMIGALLVMMTLGGLFHFLGENIQS
jgi:Na+/citrate or Na+/malate symporter